jgi:hypothetical protein
VTQTQKQMPEGTPSPLQAKLIGWTKWEHGAAPVEKTDSGWNIHWPDRVESYDSGRALMRALHGGRDPHLTVERYFRLGKHQAAPAPVVENLVEPQLTTLELFGVVDLVPAAAPARNLRKRSGARTRVRLRRTKPAPRADGGLVTYLQVVPDPGPVLGIDLVNRSHEVRKLLFAGFGKRIVAMGYEPDDVLQDVYRGLLARNIGKCPWDARKASFGHYVHMVCGCILSNYHRRYDRINKRERTGVLDWSDGARVMVDVAESSLPVFKADQDHTMRRDELVMDLENLICVELEEPYLALSALPYVLEGRGRREIAKLIGEREGKVGHAINDIRQLSLKVLTC